MAKGKGFPKTRTELEAAGYRFAGYRTRQGDNCGKEMEIWITPRNKRMPFDRMPNPDSEAITHFATCPDAPRFRA